MLKIRHIVIALGILSGSVATADAQISIGIGFPNVNIGINLPIYPNLVVVPGYPVYYAPQMDVNYFFYDGMYWVYQNDNWYTSSWYNGPWEYVDPEFVPLFILRIPVRYYRYPPAYFRGWRADRAPRWGDHWGHGWEQHRSGWDRWNRRAAPEPAPLPAYQRQYSGNRYPRQVEQQRQLINRNYHYQPSDPVVRQHFRGKAAQGAPVDRGTRQQTIQRSAPTRQQNAPAAPRTQSPQNRGTNVQRSAPVPQQGRTQVQDRRQPPQAAQHKKQPKKPADQQGQQGQQGQQDQQDRQRQGGATNGPERGQQQGRGRDRNE
jgi:hypothetical protein